ncbi:MAG: hypothetical protein V3W32_06850 [Gemmatimonadota bacterium]
MKPTSFPEVNVIFAKDQAEYLNLPAWRSDGDDGETVTCWELTWRERLRLLLTGRLWIRMLAFQGPLQPILPQLEKPDRMWVPIEKAPEVLIDGKSS